MGVGMLILISFNLLLQGFSRAHGQVWPSDLYFPDFLDSRAAEF
jgi:hypothetical protein